MNTYDVFDKLIFWVSRTVCTVNVVMWAYVLIVMMLLRIICRGLTHKEAEARFQRAIDYAMVKEFDALHETLQACFWLELALIASLWLAGVPVERPYISVMLIETGELCCIMTGLALSFGHVIRICAPSCAIQAKSLADRIFRCAKRMVFISLVYGVFCWVIHM